MGSYAGRENGNLLPFLKIEVTEGAILEIEEDQLKYKGIKRAEG